MDPAAGLKAPPPPARTKAPAAQDVVRHKGGALTGAPSKAAALPKDGGAPSATEAAVPKNGSSGSQDLPVANLAPPGDQPNGPPPAEPLELPGAMDINGASRGRHAEGDQAAQAIGVRERAPRGRQLRTNFAPRLRRPAHGERGSTVSPTRKARRKCPAHEVPDPACGYCEWIAKGKPSPVKDRDRRRRPKRNYSDSDSDTEGDSRGRPRARKRRHGHSRDEAYERTLAESLQFQRAQPQDRTQNHIAEPPREWPPQHPSNSHTPTYFGIEVPTLVHPLDDSRGEAFLSEFGRQYNLDSRVIRYLLENEGIDCLEVPLRLLRYL